MSERYTKSERITVSKFECSCAETGKTINKGEKCLYSPKNKLVFHIESNNAIDFVESTKLGF